MIGTTIACVFGAAGTGIGIANTITCHQLNKRVENIEDRLDKFEENTKTLSDLLDNTICGLEKNNKQLNEESKLVSTLVDKTNVLAATSALLTKAALAAIVE